MFDFEKYNKSTISTTEFNSKLETILTKDWLEKDFGPSKNKANYRKNLKSIVILDAFNKIHLEKYDTTIADEDVMYITERNNKVYNFIFGEVYLEESNNKNLGLKEVKVNFHSSFPSFAKIFVDYVLGTITFFNGKLYHVDARQAKLLDQIEIQKRYDFKNDVEFVVEILKGIDSILQIIPVRKFEPFKIAGKDFVIDLVEHRIFRTTQNPFVSYFKYYDVDYETARASEKIANKFLNNVIADGDSLHNARLQTYYIMQVACGRINKQYFFVSKSGVRTGKGLRHLAMRALFNTIDVELDYLSGNSFESINAWAKFAGGEMALATEQGNLIGDRIERILKIIATEKTHAARKIGGNQIMIDLTSVLCIDTNKNVSFSDEMNGRRVQIQYLDRPKEETDIERFKFFAEFWETFTNDDQSPKIEGAIGLLFDSIEYFNNHSKQEFIWKTVELINNVELDNFQIELINRFKQSEFVERDEFMSNLYLQIYGRNNNLASNALRTIGVTSTRKQISGKKVSGYIIGNRQRFDTFIKSEDDEIVDTSNLNDAQLSNISTNSNDTGSSVYHFHEEPLPF
ncbi:phage resistance protein [Streptococcus suis]|uniref:phage resistance protein n=2 Tax=Streptococcus suis TaxID=1307 RepID=UPI0004205CD5|nr:phage resistance protein [Streptococcus suis]WNO80861.1 phage resistance protein [Streptococcus suis]WNO82930.1 phage resistance protein [Streptococcus suis]